MDLLQRLLLLLLILLPGTFVRGAPTLSPTPDNPAVWILDFGSPCPFAPPPHTPCETSPLVLSPPVPHATHWLSDSTIQVTFHSPPPFATPLIWHLDSRYLSRFRPECEFDLNTLRLPPYNPTQPAQPRLQASSASYSYLPATPEQPAPQPLLSPIFTSSVYSPGADDSFQILFSDITSIHITTKALPLNLSPDTLRQLTRNPRLSPRLSPPIIESPPINHIAFPVPDLGIPSSTSFPTKSLFPAQPPSGHYLIEILATTRDGKTFSRNKILQVSSIGALVKLSRSNIFLALFSLDSGNPAEQIRVDLLDTKGQIIISQIAPDGCCLLPSLPRNVDSILASKGNQRLVLPIEDLENFRAKCASSPVAPPSPSSTGLMLFTDRPLYQPGETIHIMGLVRDIVGNKLRIKDNDRFIIEISSGKTTLCASSVELCHPGAFSFDWKLPADCTGDINIKVISCNLPAESTPVAEVNVHSTPFAAPPITAHLNVAKTQTPDLLDFSLSASYSNGIPLAKTPALISQSCHITPFSSKDFPNFSFGFQPFPSPLLPACLPAADPASSQYSCHLALDSLGKLSWPVKLPSTPFSSPIVFRTLAEITSPSGTSAKTHLTTRFYNAAHQIGVLNDSIATEHAPRLNLQFVALSSKGKPLPSSCDFIVAVRRFPLVPPSPSLSAHPPVPLDTFPEFRVASQPDGKITPLSIPTPEPGLYEISFLTRHDKGSTALTTVYRYSLPEEINVWDFFETSSLLVCPDRDFYQEGDIANIRILTPTTGKALITIESDTVLQHYWLNITPRNNNLSIPIPANIAHQVTISVTALGGFSNSLSRLPKLRSGSCAIQIIPTSSKLSVSTSVSPEKIFPGSQLRISGQVKDAHNRPVPNAYVTLYAINSCFLNGDIPPFIPDPLSGLFCPSARLQHIASYLSFLPKHCSSCFPYPSPIPAQPASSPPPDIWSQSIAPQLAGCDPSSSCPIWVPSLKTDSDGNFSFSSQLHAPPGDYTLIAIASASANLFGSSISSFNCRPPLTLSTQAPPIARVGDQLQLSATLTNSSDESGIWEVSLSASPSSFAYPPKFSGDASFQKFSQTLELPAQSTRTITFPFEPKVPGKGSLVWTLSPKIADTAPLTPVIPTKITSTSSITVEPGPENILSAFAFAGKLSSPSSEVTPILPFFPDTMSRTPGSVEVTLYNSPKGELSSVIREMTFAHAPSLTPSCYLLDFWLHAQQYQLHSPIKKISPELSRQEALDCLNRILCLQLPDGAFSEFPGFSASIDSCALATSTLAKASSMGLPVPAAALLSASQHLLSRLHTPDVPPATRICAARALLKTRRITPTNFYRFLRDIANRPLPYSTKAQLLLLLNECPPDFRSQLHAELLKSQRRKLSTISKPVLLAESAINSEFPLLRCLALHPATPPDLWIPQTLDTLAAYTHQPPSCYSLSESALALELYRLLPDSLQQDSLHIEVASASTQTSCFLSPEEPLVTITQTSAPKSAHFSTIQSLFGSPFCMMRFTPSHLPPSLPAFSPPHLPSVSRQYFRLANNSRSWIPTQSFTSGDLALVQITISQPPVINPQSSCFILDPLPSGFTQLATNPDSADFPDLPPAPFNSPLAVTSPLPPDSFPPANPTALHSQPFAHIEYHPAYTAFALAPQYSNLSLQFHYLARVSCPGTLWAPPARLTPSPSAPASQTSLSNSSSLSVSPPDDPCN